MSRPGERNGCLTSTLTVVAFWGIGLLLVIAIGAVVIGVSGGPSSGPSAPVPEAPAPAANAAARPASDSDVALGAAIAVGSAVAGILIFVALVRWRGDGYRWRLGVRASSDIPSELPPAQVAFLWDTRTLCVNGFNATLLDLVRRGVLTLETVKGNDGGIDRRLAVDHAHQEQLRPFEHSLTQLIFEFLAKGDRATVSELRRVALRMPDDFEAGLRQFRDDVFELCRQQGLAASQDWAGTWLVRLDAGIVVLGAFAGESLAHRPLLALCGLAAIPILVVAGRRMWRPSGAAVALFRRYLSLREFIVASGGMGEQPPEAVVVWEQYLALAEALGAATGVNRGLHIDFVAPPSDIRREDRWRTTEIVRFERGGFEDRELSDN
jgi:hypothetical protein